MTATLREAAPGDAAALNAVINAVSGEGRFLSTRAGFTVEQTRDFMDACRQRGVQMVLEADGAIVGWCDIVADARPEFAHGGTLAMGLLPAWRGKGWGRKLAAQCLAAAAARGVERVQLEVYHDNAAALGLYCSLGFVEEGRRRRVRRSGGLEQDAILMARWSELVDESQ